MDSARAELARRVLDTLAKGDIVPFHDAIQPRNWAIHPEDAMLSLAEIAQGKIKRKTATQTLPSRDKGQARPWTYHPAPQAIKRPFLPLMMIRIF